MATFLRVDLPKTKTELQKRPIFLEGTNIEVSQMKRLFMGVEKSPGLCSIGKMVLEESMKSSSRRCNEYSH